MNTRLQVEHPVTEEVTGLDLVAMQLSVADGDPLDEDEFEFRPCSGTPIEVRLTAEDPAAGYRPSVGTFHRFDDGEPWAVRVDTGDRGRGRPCRRSTTRWSPRSSRHGAHPRRGDPPARRLALDGHSCTGRSTNRDQLLNVLRHPDVRRRRTSTPASSTSIPCTDPIRGDVTLAAAAAALATRRPTGRRRAVLAAIPSGFRNNPAVDQVVELALDEQPVRVTYRLGRDRHVHGGRRQRSMPPSCRRRPTRSCSTTTGCVGVPRRAASGDQCFVDATDGHVTFTVLPRHPDPDAALAAGSLVAPMPGNVLRVLVAAGDAVTAGQPLVVVEAMKMEHQVLAPADGTVATDPRHPGRAGRHRPAAAADAERGDPT